MGGPILVAPDFSATAHGRHVEFVDRTHYLADALLNGAVLATLLLTRASGWERADPAFAFAITGYMMMGAGRVIVAASRQLLDHELPDEQRKLIDALVLARSGARGISDFRTPDAGDRVFVEFHLEVDGDLSVQEGHGIIDAAERAITALFPKDTEVIGHLEPARVSGPKPNSRGV